MLCVNLKNNKYHIDKTYNANVYRVVDEWSTCTYILKKCPQESNLHYKHQFKTEIYILSNLHHPLTPTLIECFEENEDQYFVESYIPGVQAKCWIQNYKGWIFRYVLIFDVLSVLKSLHQLGYLYIDLKLENLIYYNKHFYLIDFNACIENHAKVAIMASKSNCAPELLQIKEKDERADVYALGSLLNDVFGFSMKFLVFLCHRKQEKRLPNLKLFQFYIYIHLGLRIVFVLVLCILSVFYLLPSTKNDTVFDVYYKQHNVSLFERAYKETKSKNRLYTWIVNDWILDEVYENGQTSYFLMNEALALKDTALIQYIYTHVNLKEYPQLNLYVQVYLKPDAKKMNQCIQEILKTEYLLKDKMQYLNQCLQITIEKEFKISISSLYAWIENLDGNQAVSCGQTFENLGCNYLEYALLLRNKESEIMEIPTVFIDCLSSERWNQLYAFWRSL